MSTKANYNTTQFANIDPFQIIYVEDTLLPSDFESQFDEPLLKFSNDETTDITIPDLQVSDTNAVEYSMIWYNDFSFS